MLQVQIPNEKGNGAYDSTALAKPTNNLHSVTQLHDTQVSNFDFCENGEEQGLNRASPVNLDLPKPDKVAILATLATLFDIDDVVELRAIAKNGKKRTDAGYFDSDHWPNLADHAARLSATGAAVYVTLNPVDPQLLGRYNNRIEAWPTATTNDKQIMRRRWLLIDLDSVRPSNTSVTNIQLEAAKSKAREIYLYLKGLGWPAPTMAQSGNGYHLLYPIDLPNDEASTALVKAVLFSLSEYFDDAETKVDRSVFNAARVCKLYGTVANKGDHTAAAPWRLSKLISQPARVEVTADQLRLIPLHSTSRMESATTGTLTIPNHAQSNFQLEDFLERHGMDYRVDQHDGRERFRLAKCPFNQDHINGEAAIFRDLNGKLGFRCMHDSCSSKNWQSVREQFDGPRMQSAPFQAKPIATESSVLACDIPTVWPEPTPLPNALPPVAPFDAELLPVALRAWVMDIAHLMQCPPDFSAIGAVAALSSLIGARAVIQPKARVDWYVVPNLWALIVGRPGVMKSPALGEVMRPLNSLEAKERELWEAAHNSWELDGKVAAMQADANEKKAKGHAAKGDMTAARQLLEPGDTPQEPIARSYVENDITVEKLGEVLQENPWGLMVYRDELYGLLTALDKPGQEGSRGFYLQSYDGNQGYKFSRIGRGITYIQRICLAILGGTQPGKIQQYVRDAVAGGSGDDGLLQRFSLAVWPDITGEFKYVDQWPDTPAKQSAWAVFERLADLQPATDTEAAIWRFSPEAQALFIEWIVPFENEIRGEELHPAMVSHLAKYRKLIPALALIFALIDTPDSGGIVHESELARALAMGDYLRSHANRLYAAAVIPETTNAATLLAKIKSGRLADREGVLLDSFTPRHVALKHWAGLATPDAVRKAADVLADFDFLRREVAQSTDTLGRGRPSERYFINPAVFKCRAV